MAKKNSTEINGTEPLSTFQDLKKTGRVDTAPSKTDIDPQNLTITKVKLVGDDYLEIEFVKAEQDGSHPPMSYSNPQRPAHPDFRSALGKLRAHWGILNTFIDPPAKKKSLDTINEERLEPFTVTGITLSKSITDQWVIITGYKRRADGKAVIVNTPKERFERQEDEDGYECLQELIDDVELVVEEGRLYIGGKRDKKTVQGEMVLNDPEDIDE